MTTAPPTGSYVPPTQQTPSEAPPPQKSGCWKWGISGCGCLVLLGIVLIVGAAAVGVHLIKRSEIYKATWQRVHNDPRVISALGSPVEAGWMITGSVHADSEGGNAEMRFPISGPKGKAKVHAVATYENDAWQFKMLHVTPENGAPPIDLTQSPGSM